MPDTTPADMETQVKTPPAQRQPPPLATDDLPLPLLMPDGAIRVVAIPRMDAMTFQFFKQQLEAYKGAIVRTGAGDSQETE